MTPTVPMSPDREALLYGAGSGPLHLIRLWMAGLLRRPAGWRQSRQRRRVLHKLLLAEDYLLDDIGLTRQEVRQMLARPLHQPTAGRA